MSPRLSLPSDLVVRTRWYIRLRWFVLVAVSVPAIFSLYVGEGWSAQVQRDTMLGVLAIASNGIFFMLGNLRKSDRYYRNLAIGLLLFDILLVTFLIYTKGGIESRSPILYALPILISSAIFGRRSAAYITSLACIIAYNSLIILDYKGVITSLDTITHWPNDFAFVLNSVIFMSSVFLILGFLSDYITHLLLTKERQLMIGSEALKRAESIAKLGSWEWDITKNRFTWSDELYKIFGLQKKPEKITFQTSIKLVHPDDVKYVTSKIGHALKYGTPFSFDYRAKVKDGNIHIVHIEGQVIQSKKNKPTKMYGTARDVTAMHALEIAKGDFVSLASHQLRTPATGVKVLLALLTEGYAGKLTSKQMDLLQQAADANERQLKIANDLLQVARLESGSIKLKKKELDMNQWLREVIAGHESHAKLKNQTITLQLPDKPVTYKADPNRLEMAIDNLVSNAVKYSRKGGVITVILKETLSNIRIEVNDEGIGIAKHEMPKLFHKFARIDNSLSSEVEGTGLGLYLAKKIIDLHKGNIKVSSRPNNGTSFKVLLPK